ncbi:MAG TPA: cyclophilin-like fold protein, partial [Phycisphaerae bacterium]|nr:cyclophilin-like fold protein [Phycisphaerae bacterium]
MPQAIRITIGEMVFDAELNDSGTAARILDALPIDGEVNRWGDEIYFTIPVEGDRSDSMRTEMSVGELAYWPPGAAFCIFWGPTPASKGDEPRAASNVVPIGRVIGD